MKATIATIASVLLSLIFQQCYIARAKGPVTYVVGDDLGWTLEANPESWTRGKKFYAGDILEFKYDTEDANVVAVEKKDHDDCSVSDTSAFYGSGDDKIQLQFGANYFICSWPPNQCQMGMKMAINATARPPSLLVH
ncbi:PREDICTED: basic blue protein [Populus euphratica]|uniref:Basic blue protein n=1 Tax=Populus euphratica TaxID=75702 RepID=A0AAJ6U415_POPEU|nr:PREDICTED: basic blue protein [Populus euphratica]